jgi:hypothetical protein
MDRAAEKIPLRSEEAAGCGILYRECMIGKDSSLVLIHFRGERGTGRDRFAFEREGAGLVFNNNIIAERHAAPSALPAGETHGSDILISQEVGVTAKECFTHDSEVIPGSYTIKSDRTFSNVIGDLFKYQDNAQWMTGNDRLDKKYFVFSAALIVAIGIFGALTAQLLITAVLIGMVASCTFILNRYQGGTMVLDDPEGGEAILAAVIVTIAGALVSVWLLWAVAIAALLLIQQSLSRIEKRLAE